MRALFTLGLVAALALPAAAQIIVETPEARPTFGVRIADGGILAESVDADSRAARAGIEAGDVILSFGGTPVTDLDSVRKARDGAPVGQDLEVVVVRGPNFDEMKRVTLRFDDASQRALGVLVREGVRVVGVNANSVAQRAGLRAGDFLVRFGDLVGPTFTTLREAIGRVTPKQSVPVVVLRDGAEVTLRASFAPTTRPTPAPAPAPVPAPPAPVAPGAGPTSPSAALLEEARGEIDGAIATLKAMEAHPKVDATLERLMRARAALEMARKMMRQEGSRALPVAPGFDDFGAPALPGLDRLLALLSDGIDPQRAAEIMNLEFPELRLTIAADETEQGAMRIELEAATLEGQAGPDQVEEMEEIEEIERIEADREGAADAPERIEIRRRGIETPRLPSRVDRERQAREHERREADRRAAEEAVRPDAAR